MQNTSLSQCTPLFRGPTWRVDSLGHCTENLRSPHFWMVFVHLCASTGEYGLLCACLRIHGDNKWNVFSSGAPSLQLFERHGNLNPNNTSSKRSLSRKQYPTPRLASSSREPKQAPGWMKNYWEWKKQLNFIPYLNFTEQLLMLSGI